MEEVYCDIRRYHVLALKDYKGHRHGGGGKPRRVSPGIERDLGSEKATTTRDEKGDSVFIRGGKGSKICETRRIDSFSSL